METPVKIIDIDDVKTEDLKPILPFVIGLVNKVLGDKEHKKLDTGLFITGKDSYHDGVIYYSGAFGSFSTMTTKSLPKKTYLDILEYLELEEEGSEVEIIFNQTMYVSVPVFFNPYFGIKMEGIVYPSYGIGLKMVHLVVNGEDHLFEIKDFAIENKIGPCVITIVTEIKDEDKDTKIGAYRTNIDKLDEEGRWAYTHELGIKEETTNLTFTLGDFLDGTTTVDTVMATKELRDLEQEGNPPVRH